MLKVSKLNFLNYKIQEFEILVPGLYGFVGQNGAGKSTFFSILNGDISAKGSIISSRKVMYISNLQSFDKNLRALDYFKLLSESECSSAKKLSELFDINSFIDKKIGKYSLGMLQQFAIIISLAANSEIVIFDELHSGLDLKHQRIFFDILQHEKKEKIIILTSHHLEDVKNNCDVSFFLDKDIEVIKDFNDVENRIIGG